MKILNSLDIKVSFTKNTNFRYKKPYHESGPVGSMSKNPPNILKHLPKSINRRIRALSCSD